ncbi:MAG: hypothetical protein WC728_11375 [Elusimicrobiota bacterium]
MRETILHELRDHAPFTLFGAATGIVIMLLCRNLPHDVSHKIFYILHPAHVLLGALVTSSMYEKHAEGASLWALLGIGFVGAVGLATLSDSLLPYLCEAALGMPERELHVGCMEKWWLVNPIALIGLAIAYYRPITKLPHSGHVLVSTWASLFHILMALGTMELSIPKLLFVFVSLFVAVWLPCCFSDIVFPLLFVRSPAKKTCLHSCCHR